MATATAWDESVTQCGPQNTLQDSSLAAWEVTVDETTVSNLAEFRGRSLKEYQFPFYCQKKMRPLYPEDHNGSVSIGKLFQSFSGASLQESVHKNSWLLDPEGQR
ncbi:hypothetical protein CDAR_502621 [Caerostris darwini]|uniref:Uncharacterized protein n=1 Tax=Caerostris darwini TaxID=1538125 RepID=A0AAV4RLZ5_9ARAC|nr:hypothetical protein CDAR_502621 [Caerostris darwini]